MRLLWFLSAVAAFAGPRPDFTGEWRLVPSKSNFDRQAPPKSRIIQLDHRDPTFVVRTLEDGSHGAVDATAFYSSDGVARVNDVLGNAFKSISRWDGSVLEVRSAGKVGSKDVSLVERYEIKDPSTLVLSRRFEGPTAQQQTLIHELVPLKAGVASVDITPPGSMDMYGYASRKCGPSNGTHDPLMAKVLVLESAAARLAIVTLDLGSIVSERLRQQASAKLGVSLLLLSASHTHSGPLFIPSSSGATVRGGPEYLDELEHKILRAIQQASDSVFPARLRTARASVQLGYNRLVRRENGRARAVFDNLDRLPYGPLDTEFMLLEVADMQGSPKALVTHYATHPVVLGPTNCKYSADFPGAFHASVEAALPGVQSMFVQGGAGDINPLLLGRTGKEEADFGLVKKTGDLLAAAVLQARAGLSSVPQASLPIRVKSEVLRFNDRWSPHRSHDIGIATALIGRDIAIGSVPGEPLHTLQTAWKQQADVAFPLFYGYTYSAGGGWPGYLPDLRSAAYGGYGADSSTTRVEVGTGERLVQRLLIHLYDLRGFWASSPGLP